MSSGKCHYTPSTLMGTKDQCERLIPWELAWLYNSESPVGMSLCWNTATAGLDPGPQGVKGTVFKWCQFIPCCTFLLNIHRLPKPLEAVQLPTRSSEPPSNWGVGGLGSFWPIDCIIKPWNMFPNWMFQVYEYMKKKAPCPLLPCFLSLRKF